MCKNLIEELRTRLTPETYRITRMFESSLSEIEICERQGICSADLYAHKVEIAQCINQIPDIDGNVSAKNVRQYLQCEAIRLEFLRISTLGRSCRIDMRRGVADCPEVKIVEGVVCGSSVAFSLKSQNGRVSNSFTVKFSQPRGANLIDDQQVTLVVIDIMDVKHIIAERFDKVRSGISNGDPTMLHIIKNTIDAVMKDRSKDI